ANGRFAPHCLVYGDGRQQRAYVCVLTVGVAGLRFGLVQCGPLSLHSGALDVSALLGLPQWARVRRAAVLRVYHFGSQMLNLLESVGPVHEVESFPFHRDPRNKLIVRQCSDDEQLLASFQKVARYEIRSAMRAGYEIRVSDEPEALREVWPMLVGLARRK